MRTSKVKMPLDELKGLIITAFEKDSLNFKTQEGGVVFDLKGKTMKAFPDLTVKCLSEKGWDTTLSSHLVSSLLKSTLKKLMVA